MSSLLCRTIARASAMICRWPTERFPPPLEIGLSSVSRPSAAPSCSEYSPAARSASFSSASSYASNGSMFARSVPVSSSGCGI